MTELHIAVDAAGLVDRQQAVTVGREVPHLPGAVGVGDGGDCRRGGLEQIELVLEGLGADGDGVGHAGGGVGGGDGDLRRGAGGGDRHLALGQVGLIGQVLDVVPQAALLVVDGDVLRALLQGPPDAVPEAAPVVVVGVDAHIPDEAQGLAQLHDVLAVCERGFVAVAVHHRLIAQGDVVLLRPVHQDGQGAALVDIDHDGVGAGGEGGAVRYLALILREGDGVGVVEGVPFYLAGGEGDGAGVGNGGGRQPIPGIIDRGAALHAGDGQDAAGVLVPGDGVVEGQSAVIRVRDGGRVRRDPHLGGGREDGEGGGGGQGGLPLHRVGQGDRYRVLALGVAGGQGVRRDLQLGDICDGPVHDSISLAVRDGDGEGVFLFRVEHHGVGDPDDREGVARLDQGVLGVLGDGQGEPAAGGDGEGDRAEHVIGVIIRRAVVGGEGKGDLAHRAAGGDYGPGRHIIFAVADVGDVRGVAAPGAGGVCGCSACLGVERRLELGEGRVVQGDGGAWAAVRPADGDALHIHLGVHGDGLGHPVDGDPVPLARGPVRSSLIDLELDGDGPLLGGGGDRVRLRHEGEGLVRS